MTRLVLLAFSFVWGYSMGCSFPEGQKIKSYTMVETLERASVVVSGKDLYRDPPDISGPNNHTFQVSCVFKANGLNIPRTIYLLDVGATSCETTYMEVSQSYILALRAATEDEITLGDPGMDSYPGRDSDIPYYFMIDEPDAYNGGAFNATSENLATTSKLCSMDSETLSLGRGGPDDHVCPVKGTSNGTIETCLTGASPALLAANSTRDLAMFVTLALSAILSQMFVF